MRAWLHERERSVDEVVDVFLGAGAGLAAAHAENIVHRFKLDNVLVQDDGTPTVIDFGFAITTPTLDGIPADATQDDAGTDPYLAPEAKRGLARDEAIRSPSRSRWWGQSLYRTAR